MKKKECKRITYGKEKRREHQKHHTCCRIAGPDMVFCEKIKRQPKSRRGSKTHHLPFCQVEHDLALYFCKVFRHTHICHFYTCGRNLSGRGTPFPAAYPFFLFPLNAPRKWLLTNLMSLSARSTAPPYMPLPQTGRSAYSMKSVLMTLIRHRCPRISS